MQPTDYYVEEVQPVRSPFLWKYSLMRTKYRISFMLVLFLLTACSGQPSQEPFVTQTLAPTREFIMFTSIPKTVDVTTTHTLIPAATAQILSTQTPTVADLESLPKLSEVVLSSIDFETTEELGYNSLILATDFTNELQGVCLWDCVKYLYSLEHGTLTIMLLRAGDNQKAFNTAQGLRNDFLKNIHYEYTSDEFVGMPQGSWLIVHKSSKKCQLNATMGLSYGSIVILSTLTRIVCEETEHGTYGEVDLFGFAYDVVIYTNAQVEKLVHAGYPK